MSKIPGTEAHKEAKAEQGTGSGMGSNSSNTGSGDFYLSAALSNALSCLACIEQLAASLYYAYALTMCIAQPACLRGAACCVVPVGQQSAWFSTKSIIAAAHLCEFLVQSLHSCPFGVVHQNYAVQTLSIAPVASNSWTQQRPVMLQVSVVLWGVMEVSTAQAWVQAQA